MQNKQNERTFSFLGVLYRLGFIFFISTLLAFISTFLLTQKELSRSTEEELLSVVEIIKQSIKSTHDSAQALEHLVDLRLYAISKAIAEELRGRTIDEVTTEDLVRLKMKWDLSDISLFVKKDNGDIPIVLSSDPKEVGLNAKRWGYWYTAIGELFEGKPVSVTKGYSDKHYWIGPVSLSEVHDKHFKYAYYYDGTTGFMINPYIASDDIYKFIRTSGPTQLIENIVEGHQNINEIAVINLSAYLGAEFKVIEPMTDLPILYGSAKTVLSEDIPIFGKGLSEPVFHRVSFERDGRDYEKIYISLPEKRMLTLVINSENQERVQAHLFILFSVIFILTFLCMAIVAKFLTSRPLKLLESEKERLRVAEEFKRTMEILPSAIYKCKKDDQSNYIFTYAEGKVMEELGFMTEKVQGKRWSHLNLPQVLEPMIPALDAAFQGEQAEFNFSLRDRTYHNVLKPIYDLEESRRIVEVAGYSIDITEKVKSEERINHLALYDSLTELPNRTYFMENLERVLQPDHQKEIAMVYIDLDGFKQVNDTLGHDAGDLLLMEVSHRIKSCIPSKGFCSRMGGDEFTILIPYSQGKVEQMCQHLVELFRRPFFIQNQEFLVTVSIGVSMAPKDGSNGKILMKNADLAMYHAKQLGKNRYYFYTPELNEANKKRLEIQHELSLAIQTMDQFSLVYQPIYSLLTNQIVGVEALLRWEHPTKGNISPAEFIPIAEECGMIGVIGDWVLHEACQQGKSWQGEGLDPIRISVNLSARQFKQPDLVKKVLKILNETGLEPHLLNLEITESSSMDDTSYTIQVLNELRDIGVHIAIDDFGTAYSSLNYLKDLPIHTLKIDHSFVWEMSKNGTGKAIVQTIIDLARNLQLFVVAEGVETEDELRLLNQMGCHQIQGYYISKPVKSEEIRKLVEVMDRSLDHLSSK